MSCQRSMLNTIDNREEVLEMKKLVKKIKHKKLVSLYFVNECTNENGANCGNCVQGCS